MTNAIRTLHRRRTGWFAVLVAGILTIQLAYNLHAGEPKVLGYATQITAQELLTSTNEYRTGNGQPGLQLNQQLAKAAQAKAEDMAHKNYWDHVSPDGVSPWQFIEQFQYHYQLAGENLAYGFTDSAETVAAWMNSESHKANVLGNYADVGFGVVHVSHYQGGDNSIVVALYAQPKASAPATIGTPLLHTDKTSHQVHGATIVASGGAPWATYASLALLGAAAVGFAFTHLELFRLGWYRSKRFLALHPVFDASVIVIVALTLVYTAGGFIR